MSRLVVHGEIKGKRHCDLCGGDGPVFEIMVPQGKVGKKGGVNCRLWFDACRKCIKRHQSGEGVIGPLGFVRGLASTLRGTNYAD